MEARERVSGKPLEHENRLGNYLRIGIGSDRIGRVKSEVSGRNPTDRILAELK